MMALHTLDTATELVFQVTGPPAGPVAVYLPGVHGDWTPNARAREFLSLGIRLVEVAYPRTAAWQLGDFAKSLDALLGALGVSSAHLIGESFGSLVAWEVGLNYPHRVNSLLLVGGFAEPPTYAAASIAKWALRCMPTLALEAGIDAYVRYKDRGSERRPGHGRGVGPYPAARTRSGRLATASRMALIEQTDLRERLPQIVHPVRYLGGERDLVIPVQRELATLHKHLSRHCDFRSHLIPDGPHAIIASHPEATAEKLVQWITDLERTRSCAVSSRGNQ